MCLHQYGLTIKCKIVTLSTIHFTSYILLVVVIFRVLSFFYFCPFLFVVSFLVVLIAGSGSCRSTFRSNDKSTAPYYARAQYYLWNHKMCTSAFFDYVLKHKWDSCEAKGGCDKTGGRMSELLFSE